MIDKKTKETQRLNKRKENKMKTDIIRELYHYDNGQALVEFRRGGPRDWFVWDTKKSQRLATYSTRRELLAAFERSNNKNGAYGCAQLDL